MPELPDLTIYREALERRLVGHPLDQLRLASPFLLRTTEPPPGELAGKRVVSVGRVGKRLLITLVGDYHIALHLMIAGRLRWSDAHEAKIPGRIGLAAFDFGSGTLILTEAGTKRRAALHLLRGKDAPARFDAGGVEPLEVSLETFAQALASESHTLKRALTDPRIIAGIGNAYSDEILHAARLSPLARTSSLESETVARLYDAMRSILERWIALLRNQTGDAFPNKVTAFHPDMAVHGRFGKPCPTCGSAIQRIVYAENECNYCATCQTGGKLLADRALSRLLHGDWPRTLAELEERMGGRGSEK